MLYCYNPIFLLYKLSRSFFVLDMLQLKNGLLAAKIVTLKQNFHSYLYKPARRKVENYIKKDLILKFPGQIFFNILGCKFGGNKLLYTYFSSISLNF